MKFVTLLLALSLLTLTGCGTIQREPATGPVTSASLPKPALPFDPKAPIVDFDLQGFIDAQLATGSKAITVPPGRYRVTPRKRVHLTLQNLTNITINATGVQMICTQTTQAIAINNCRNLTLIGLTVDYDPLPFTQGTITALAPDKSWIEFVIHAGYPENLVERIEIFDARTELLKTPTHYGWTPFEKIGPARYRVNKGSNYKYNPTRDREEVGDFLVTNSATAPGGSATHAIVSNRCTDLVLQDVTLYASNCFSFLEYYCDNTTYLRCRVDRCPPELDIHPRAHRRLRSGDADAYHSKHALRGPQLIGCAARFMGDDALNICGEYYMVLHGTGRQIRIVAPHGTNIKPGHEIELFAYSGLRLPDAVVLSVEPDQATTSKEISFIKAQKMNAGTRTGLSAPSAKTWRVTINREVDLPIGSAIASTQHTGNGFLVKDCNFGYNRSRGILIKASHGKIIGNTLTGSQMAAVLVAPEWWWMESGSASHVLISNNVITDCGQTAIRVVASGGTGATAPAGAHSDITIRGNTITNGIAPHIEVTSTNGLVLDNNLFPKEDATRPQPDNIRIINSTNITGSNAPLAPK